MGSRWFTPGVNERPFDRFFGERRRTCELAPHSPIMPLTCADTPFETEDIGASPDITAAHNYFTLLLPDGMAGGLTRTLADISINGEEDRIGQSETPNGYKQWAYTAYARRCSDPQLVVHGESFDTVVVVVSYRPDVDGQGESGYVQLNMSIDKANTPVFTIVIGPKDEMVLEHAGESVNTTPQNALFHESQAIRDIVSWLVENASDQNRSLENPSQDPVSHGSAEDSELVAMLHEYFTSLDSRPAKANY
jgi:hypothetical protein